MFFNELAVKQEVEDRINRLRAAYADNPLVKRIDYRIGRDWSDDPCVYVNVVLPGKDVPIPEVVKLGQQIRENPQGLAYTDDIGLHTYVRFAT